MTWTNEEYENYLLLRQKEAEDRMLNAIKLLNSTDEYCLAENVYIESREENERNTKTLVIERVDNLVAKINIEANSIHAILNEYMLYMTTGRALGLYYSGFKKK